MSDGAASSSGNATQAAPEPDIEDLPTATTPGSSHRVVGAATVRDGLQLTAHQLGEYTRRLALEVGSRPNYPRYGITEVRLLVAVQALRELQVPVDGACAAVAAFKDAVSGGRGWIVLYPTAEGWVAVSAFAAAALTSLLTMTGRAAVVDLGALRERGTAAWVGLSRPLDTEEAHPHAR